jgi:GPI mannosyltransferase 3
VIDRDIRAPPRMFALLVIVATTTRILQVLTEPAYLHPDALFQGLEPAFSLVWGHGILPWEFRDGLRSWAWPGLLAAPMLALRSLELAGPGTGMTLAVAGARVIVVVIDVAMVVLATRLALARGGVVAAVLCGGLLAVHPAWSVTGAQPLIDVPAAAALVWACERSSATDILNRRRATGLGLACALTMLVRIQLAPAIATLLLLLAWRTRRETVRWMPGAARDLGIAAAAVLVAWGVLDAVTLGGPFAATTRYLAFNLGEGQTTFGVMPPDRYVRDFVHALGLLALVLPLLAVVGTRRAGTLAIVLLAVVVPHQLLAYRVWRFLHPALPLLVILASLGLGALCCWLRAHRPRLLPWLLLTTGSLVLLEVGLAVRREAPWSTTWLHAHGGMTVVERSRGLNRAYLALSAGPAPRAIAQAVLPAAASPGYALLGHPIPVYTLLDRPLDATEANDVEMWITRSSHVPLTAELTLIWTDFVAGVEIYRRPR